MAESVPRWEWRRFGDLPHGVDAAFAALSPERVQESDETYVLSTEGTDAAKLRDGLMDVKHRLRVDDDGLEQWTPVLKAPFPLSAVDVTRVLTALGVSPAADPDRPAYTWREMVDEVVAPHPDLLAVGVHKVRQRYTIDGCAAEVTEVRTDHATTWTTAVESEDPAAVMRVLHRLGLRARPNVSFARGLGSLVRFGRDRYAVIDIGTNSVKFHVGERGADGRWRTLADRAEVTRLGEGLQETGALAPEPLRRTVDAVADMVDEAVAADVAAVVAVGTAGLRIANNSSEFVQAVRARCGVDVEVISGDDEARLAYRAAVAGLGDATGSRVVFDTGGGSSQFTFGRDDRVEERFSVDVGAVRFTEQFRLGGAVPADDVAEARRAIAADLGRLADRPAPAALAGMGGAVTNLAAVSHGLATYDADVVQGTVLDRGEIDRQIELYRTRSADERRAIAGLQPARAEVILAGACVVRTVLELLDQESLTVSDRGLRHGVLVERFGGRERAL
jgi:exopolyphosphatase/guanosine-5'-triphosphate,3'-diphosphate pyrophosphatase